MVLIMAVYYCYVLLVKEEEEDQEHVGNNITKWTGLTGDRLKTETNGERLSMKRPIFGWRTAEGKRCKV